MQQTELALVRGRRPRLAHHTIALDSAGHLHATIGLCGRLLLDAGEPTFRVIDLVQAARAAAIVSDEAAIAVLEAAGFRFVAARQ